VASAVIAKWEGKLDPLEPDVIEGPLAPAGHGPAHATHSLHDTPSLEGDRHG
jgi:hypothetical protein